MIVVDTNILLHTLIEGELTPACQALRKEDPQWLVPSLWRYEFANALRTKAKVGGIGADQAVAIMSAAMETFIPLEREVPHAASLRLAILYDVSAYDASFLALAQSVGVKLVTEDAKLVKKSHGWARSLA